MTFPHRIFRIYGQPALLAGAVIVASLLRLQTLGGSLGHDEAYTLQAFASQPYERIITSYPAPNNHILHSLLVRCSVQLLGTETWIARFPALVAGILAVPLIFVLGRSLFLNPHAGLIAAWLLAIMPAHISYSQVARGYSLSILLSVLSLFFAKKAVDEGKIRLWAAFGLCGFLGAWTLPSNAFLVVSLGIWAGLVASRNVRSKAIATTLASVLVIVLVYLPIRAELERAGGRWGIDVWEDPLALPGVFVGTAKIWIGGMEGIFPAVAALGGLLLTVYRRRDIALCFGSAWLVPLLAAVVMGIAGQPRSYLYLLPTFVLSAAYGITQVPTTRLRAIALTFLLVGYGWSATTILNKPKIDAYKALAQYMETELVAADMVVSPFIMDVRIWAYAGETIGRSLIAILRGGTIDRLFVASHSVDERFELKNSLLKSHAGPISIPFRTESFVEVYHSGELALNKIRSSGVRVFLLEETIGWHQAATQEAQSLRLTSGTPAISGAPSLHLENSARTPFQLYSTTRFDVPTEGIAILAFARTRKDSYLSIYSVSDNKELGRPHLLKTAAWPTPVRGNDGQKWLLEAYLLPVEPQVAYGLYILGGDDEEQSLADITCIYFPY